MILASIILLLIIIVGIKELAKNIDSKRNNPIVIFVKRVITFLFLSLNFPFFAIKPSVFINF